MRPVEVEHLVGDASQAQQKLGWSLHELRGLVRLMVDADLELLARGVSQKQAG